MARNHSSTPTKAAAGLAGILLGFHGAFGLMFVVMFDYSWRVLALHLVLAIACVVVVLVVGRILYQTALRASQRLAQLALLASLACYIASFTAFYLVNVATNYGWGSHLNGSLAARAFEHLAGLWEVFPRELLGAFFALMIILLVVVGGLRYALPWIEPAFAAKAKASFSPRRCVALLSVGAYFGGILFSVLANYEAYALGVWEGEPIVALLQQEVNGFRPTPQRVALSAKERLIRERYRNQNSNFERRNIVVIIVDGLRPANMSAYGYERPTTPFLDSKLRSGEMKRVEWASSPCPESVCGIMSTFTSKDFQHMSHASFGLHNLLRDKGYRVSFLLAGDHHWYGLGKFYGEDIDFYRDGRSECPYGINDDRCLLQFLDELPTVDATTPQLLGFHLMSAHMTGKPLPEYQRYKPSSRSRFLKSEREQTAVVNGYDNGVLQADYFISELWRRLERRGILRNAIVFIAADHGEALGEHGLYGHTKHVYQPLLRVPLLIFDATATDYRNLEYGSVLDIAPTALDVLGIPIPETWQGVPLTRPMPRVRATFHQTTEQNPWHAVLLQQDGSLYKYLRRGDPRTPDVEEEFYDLTSDGNETTNIRSSADAATLADVRERLNRHLLVGHLPMR